MPNKQHPLFHIRAISSWHFTLVNLIYNLQDYKFTEENASSKCTNLKLRVLVICSKWNKITKTWLNCYTIINYLIIKGTDIRVNVCQVNAKLVNCKIINNSNVQFMYFDFISFRGRIHKTSFSLLLKNKPNKLECLSLASLTSLMSCNSLAY